MFYGKLFTAGRREPVKPRPPVIRRSAPFGGHPAFLQESLQRRVQGTVFDPETLAGGLLDEFGDPVAVRGSPAQGAQDDQVQSSLHDFQAFRVSASAAHR